MTFLSSLGSFGRSSTLRRPSRSATRRFLLGHLLPGHLPHLGVGLGVEHLPGLVELAAGAAQLPEGVDDRLAARSGACPAVADRVLVAGGVDVGQARLERVELVLQVGQPLEHANTP